MLWDRYCGRKKAGVMAAVILAAGLITACGRGQEPEKGEKALIDQTDQPGQSIEDMGGSGEAAADAGENVPGAAADEIEDLQTDQDALREQFGENCIVEQTFEVEMNQYPEKVWFVPLSPTQTGQGLEIKIMQDGEVITEPDIYVPDTLAGESFVSLDAVSFYDVNFDNRTDIVLIETYGNVSFTAVYYGVGDAGSDDHRYFVLQKSLSEALSERVNPLTVTEIRNFISGGKKNGEFDGYEEAYEVMARLCDMEGAERVYDLIYVDEDDIPELSACYLGYSVSLYTYQDGTIYTLMDSWGYGAMGNAGYAYAPRKNNVINDNNDYAGAILYTTYMSISNHQTLDVTTRIETFNFDDANQNGYPDEEELDSVGMYGVSYLDGVEISAEEAASYNVGGYEFIEGRMTLDELLAALGK